MPRAYALSICTKKHVRRKTTQVQTYIRKASILRKTWDILYIFAITAKLPYTVIVNRYVHNHTERNKAACIFFLILLLPP